MKLYLLELDIEHAISTPTYENIIKLSDQSVIDRNLVSEAPKWKNIVDNHNSYYRLTDIKRFPGPVLGYVTPVSMSKSWYLLYY